MKYDLNKYKYVEHSTADGVKEVIAISTYAGKTVKGSAKCDPRDAAKYTLTDGMELAAARCNAKISAKRVARATEKLAEAHRLAELAQAHVMDMVHYLNDSQAELREAQAHEIAVFNKM